MQCVQMRILYACLACIENTPQLCNMFFVQECSLSSKFYIFTLIYLLKYLLIYCAIFLFALNKSSLCTLNIYTDDEKLQTRQPCLSLKRALSYFQEMVYGLFATSH